MNKYIKCEYTTSAENKDDLSLTRLLFNKIHNQVLQELHIRKSLFTRRALMLPEGNQTKIKMKGNKSQHCLNNTE